MSAADNDYSKRLTALRSRLTIVPGPAEAEAEPPLEPCPSCRDAGWVVRRTPGNPISEMVPCPNPRCPVRRENEQRQIEHALGDAAIPPLLEDARMETVRQSPAMLAAVEEALDARQNLWLYGPVGTGKSWLAAAILRRELERGRTGYFAVVPDLLALIRQAIGTRGADSEQVLGVIESVSLLILDDLGTERLVNSQGERNEWVWETLYRIVNARYLQKRQTIVTTNLSNKMLLDRLGERIMSRFGQSCRRLEFTGDDRRMNGRRP